MNILPVRPFPPKSSHQVPFGTEIKCTLPSVNPLIWGCESNQIIGDLLIREFLGCPISGRLADISGCVWFPGVYQHRVGPINQA